MRLPASVQELADVIGRERALYLVSQLPRCIVRDGRYKAATASRVILYVPRRMAADHELVRILGWHDAEKLRQHFGGEILHPSLCMELYRPFRDAAIRRLVGEGVPQAMVAEWFDVNPRTVKNVMMGGLVVEEIPQEGIEAANDNTAPVVNRRAG